jgi:putative aldouronate transport system permease protein
LIPGRKTLSQHLVEFKRQWELQLMVLPWIFYIFIFAYIPMYGLIMAFQEYELGDIIGFSRWVGLFHFKMFIKTPELLA